MNKVASATKMPKKPRINIGEFGKSYTGISMRIRKLNLNLNNWENVMLFYPLQPWLLGSTDRWKKILEKYLYSSLENPWNNLSCSRVSTY